MRRMPNDTITVSVGTQQFVTEFGDPGLPNDGRGGSDKMIATVDGSNAVLTFVGDDQSLQGHSHGGNDHLAATVTGFGDYAFLDGDAQAMSGDAHGGNDVLHVDASTRLSAFLAMPKARCRPTRAAAMTSSLHRWETDRPARSAETPAVP
jgi:serralysin